MILAILQARMSSTRLPGKVLKTILGHPLLALQIDRLNRCTSIDRLVVATSDEDSDQPICRLCNELGVDVYCGSLENVLDRFYNAALRYKPDHILRLTGDCPLADPVVIDQLIQFYLTHECDYASNCRPPTLPDGLDAEIFTFTALEIAWREAKLQHELEHVVPFIISNPSRFRIKNLSYKKNLSHLRWVVDESEDLEFVMKIYEELSDNPNFGMDDILHLLENRPELLEINNKYKRNEGATHSQQ